MLAAPGGFAGPTSSNVRVPCRLHAPACAQNEFGMRAAEATIVTVQVAYPPRRFHDAVARWRTHYFPEHAELEFADDLDLSTSVLEGTLGAEEASRRARVLGRVAANCPCSRAVRWVDAEPNATPATDPEPTDPEPTNPKNVDLRGDQPRSDRS